MSLAIYLTCAALAAALLASGWQIYSARGVKSSNLGRGPKLWSSVAVPPNSPPNGAGEARDGTTASRGESTESRGGRLFS